VNARIVILLWPSLRAASVLLIGVGAVVLQKFDVNEQNPATS